jgi:cytochrome c oxidase cbb3-type subunit 3
MSLPCPNASRLAFVVVLALAGCQRETRDYKGPPPPVAAPAAPGLSPTNLTTGGQSLPVAKDSRGHVYEGNAFHISEGKRYYEWYNCYGCHAAGGGDIGPALMDDRWRYGGEIEQIRASIIEGRANGMPSFRALIPDEQVWQIAAYIRSMGGAVPKTAASSRGDEIQLGEPKTQVDAAPTRTESPPDAGVGQ